LASDELNDQITSGLQLTQITNQQSKFE